MIAYLSAAAGTALGRIDAPSVDHRSLARARAPTLTHKTPGPRRAARLLCAAAVTCREASGCAAGGALAVRPEPIRQHAVI
ncbi:hypothetical protein MTO96_014452 [Rhipicephalus appendiculatus]